MLMSIPASAAEYRAMLNAELQASGGAAGAGCAGEGPQAKTTLADRQTERQTERQTVRQADRQTDKEADRQTIQTDRQTERWTDRQTNGMNE